MKIQDVPELEEWFKTLDYLTMLLLDDGQQATASDGKKMQIVRLKTLVEIKEQIDDLQKMIFLLGQYILSFGKLEELNREISKQIGLINDPLNWEKTEDNK